MKRINLSVDLENNEIFEQEVIEAIRAQVRNIVREEGAALIRREAEEEARRLFSGNNWHYHNTINTLTRNHLSNAVEKEVNSNEVAQMIYEKISESLTPIIAKAVEKETRNVESRVYTTLTRIMTDELNKNFRQILGTDRP